MSSARTSKSRQTLLAILAAVSLFAVACSSGDDSSGSADSGGSDSGDSAGDDPTTDLEPTPGGELLFALEADSDGYNPVWNLWSLSGQFVGSSIYDSLAYEIGDGNLEMGLAESITPNDDATVWTITLKPDIFFHDGTPLDAEVVKANFESRRTNPLTGSALAPIENVVVNDPLTVEVQMNTPWAGYAHTLAAQGGYVVSLANASDSAGDLDPIGTGPFEFVEHTPDSHVTVTKNEDYWGKEPYLDGIRFNMIPDVTARDQSVQAGSVDALHTSNPKSVATAREDDSLQTYEHSSDVAHILLNSAVPPFDNPLAREAVALGTNQDSLIVAIGGEDVVTPASTPFVENNPWHLEDNGYPAYDQEAATALVEQYEAETGESFAVELTAGPGVGVVVSTALVEQWQAIGIDTTFQPVEQSVFIGGVFRGDYQAGFWRSHSWIDPDFSYIFWNSESTINFTNVNSPELDAALDAGRGTLDPDERRVAYDDTQRILNEELTHLWLYDVVWAIITTQQVHGFDDAIERGFSRQDAKLFWQDVWMEQ